MEVLSWRGRILMAYRFFRWHVQSAGRNDLKMVVNSSEYQHQCKNVFRTNSHHWQINDIATIQKN